jgi:hypothetical protein
LLVIQIVIGDRSSGSVRAAALLDVQLDPIVAGKMFPFEWRQ